MPRIAAFAVVLLLLCLTAHDADSVQALVTSPTPTISPSGASGPSSAPSSQSGAAPGPSSAPSPQSGGAPRPFPDASLLASGPGPSPAASLWADAPGPYPAASLRASAPGPSPAASPSISETPGSSPAPSPTSGDGEDAAPAPAPFAGFAPESSTPTISPAGDGATFAPVDDDYDDDVQPLDDSMFPPERPISASPSPSVAFPPGLDPADEDTFSGCSGLTAGARALGWLAAALIMGVVAAF